MIAVRTCAHKGFWVVGNRHHFSSLHTNPCSVRSNWHFHMLIEFLSYHVVSIVARFRQAPNALIALTASMQPLLWPRPYLAAALPAIVNLALPGIDPNDDFKAACTLEFFAVGPPSPAPSKISCALFFLSVQSVAPAHPSVLIFYDAQPFLNCFACMDALVHNDRV